MFGNGIFGVDIDDIEDMIDQYRNGDSDNIVAEFIHSLHSYAEYSVSGKGIHIICKGTLPATGRRRKNVEMYEHGRFFVMTGNPAAEYMELADATEPIKPLHEKYIGGGAEPTTGIVRSAPIRLSEHEIIQLASNSRQGKTFSDLFAGQWDTYFSSQSEADLSLCNMLAFWCRCDEILMDQLFRQSGLMRDKWNRRQSGSTYGEITIAKAVRGCNKVYEPQPEYSVSIGVRSADQKKKRRYTFDDTGNAQRVVDIFGESILYSYANKAWLYYDGRRWCYDTTGAVKRMVDEVVESMRHDLELYTDDPPDGMDPEDVEKNFLKHIKQSRSSKSKNAMLKEAEHRVPVLPEQLDTHKTLLNTPNGTINLRTGELMPHAKKRLITKIAHSEYTDTMDIPIWEKFLLQIFQGDTELIRYIQKAIGYSISGSTKEECVFFCYGTGRNGKSTFLDVISEAIGDYGTNIQPETIMIKPNGNGPTSDIARLKGARFVTSAEPNEGVRLNEGLLKQLTGGDKVTASRKYENEFEFYPEFKLWMSTNHKPIIRGTDVGIWSRIRLIPFTVRISDDEMDRNLKHKLRAELPGILKWAVDGCLLWQKEGLAMPAAVKSATAEYRGEMDVIAAFLDECCEEREGTVRANELFQVYLKWAKENNEYEMKSTKFGIEISKKFNKQKDRNGWHYSGINIKKEHRPYQINFEKL